MSLANDGFNGVGVLTTFRVDVGALPGVLADVVPATARAAAPTGRKTAVMACIGAVDLMVLVTAPDLRLMDDVPSSPRATARAFTGFLCPDGVTLRRMLGVPEATEPDATPGKNGVWPPWVGDLKEFFQTEPGKAGSYTFHAVIYSQLSPEALLGNPTGVSRRDRLMQAIQAAYGPLSPLSRLQRAKQQSTVHPSRGKFRAFPVLGADEVDLIHFIQCDDLDVLSEIALALRWTTWSPADWAERHEHGILSQLGASQDRAGVVADLPLFEGVSTTPSLRMFLMPPSVPPGPTRAPTPTDPPAQGASGLGSPGSASPGSASSDAASAVRSADDGGSQGQPPGPTWRVLVPPKFDPNGAPTPPVARSAQVTTSVSYPTSAESWVRDQFALDDGPNPFGAHQLKIPRCHGTSLSADMISELMAQGLGLGANGPASTALESPPGPHHLSGVHAETTISVMTPVRPASPRFAPSGLHATLSRARSFHASEDGGLVSRWTRACRLAALTGSEERQGTQIIQSILRRVVANPELFGVPIPLVMEMVRSAEQLIPPDAGRPWWNRPAPGMRAHRVRVAACLTALNDFAAAHPADIGSRTGFRGRRLPLRGQAGWRLTTDAIGAMALGWWARLRRGAQTVLVLHHAGPTLRVQSIGTQALILRLPATPVRLSPLDWHLPAGLAGCCFATIRYDDVNRAGDHGSLSDFRRTWAELAGACGSGPPAGWNTLGDLMKVAGAELRAHRGNLWTEAFAGLTWRLPAVQLGAALLATCALEDLPSRPDGTSNRERSGVFDPWFLVGPHIVRETQASLEQGVDPRLAFSTALVGILAASLPNATVTGSTVTETLGRMLSALERLGSSPWDAAGLPPPIGQRVRALCEDLDVDRDFLPDVAKRLRLGIEAATRRAGEPHLQDATAIIDGIATLARLAGAALLGAPLFPPGARPRGRPSRRLFLEYATFCARNRAAEPITPWLPFAAVRGFEEGDLTDEVRQTRDRAREVARHRGFLPGPVAGFDRRGRLFQLPATDEPTGAPPASGTSPATAPSASPSAASPSSLTGPGTPTTTITGPSAPTKNSLATEPYLEQSSNLIVSLAGLGLDSVGLDLLPVISTATS